MAKFRRLGSVAAGLERLLNMVFYISMSNGHRSGETPEPIPNSEAKTAHDKKYCVYAWESLLLVWHFICP